MLVVFDSNTTRLASEHTPRYWPGDVVGRNPVVDAEHERCFIPCLLFNFHKKFILPMDGCAVGLGAPVARMIYFEGAI